MIINCSTLLCFTGGVGELNGNIETADTMAVDPPAGIEAPHNHQLPSPTSAAASLFDFNQFFNVEHIPGLGVSGCLGHCHVNCLRSICMLIVERQAVTFT